VLHTHLPWLGNHGTWPVGEEWLFEAWAHAWLPVTRLLEELADEGRREVLTLGVTPMVAAQVADERLARDLGTWLGSACWRAEEQRWQWHQPAAVRALSTHHWVHHARLLDYHLAVEDRGGLLAVWRDLQDRGVVELLGGPATHPYLPLVTDPAMVAAQLETGLESHARWAGRRPTGLWPPELGYRPRGRVADATAPPLALDAHGTPVLPRRGAVVPGLEEAYADAGIRHVLVDAPTLVRAVGGTDRDWTRRPAVPHPDEGSPDEVVRDGVLVGDGPVVAYARDLSVAYRVWSPTEGYPGDPWYRDFHARGEFGNHPSWRVTGLDVPPDRKATWDPDHATARVAAHVTDLHDLLRNVLVPRPGGLVVAAYDTELFGHWWHEGPDWLAGLLRAVDDDPALRLTTLESRRTRRPPTRRLSLQESSWGLGKGHATWVTPATRPIWQRLAAAESMASAAVAASTDTVRTRAVVEQLAREVAQLRCSDWPFMLTRGASPDYGLRRVAAHADAVEELVAMLGSGTVDTERVALLRARTPAPVDVGPLVAPRSPSAT
jgi:1,4-alpha-glucan branching enzyme